MAQNGKGDGHDKGNGHDRATSDLLAFPARVHIKAIGNASSRFEALVHQIVSRHIAPAALLSATTRASRGGKYLAVTLTIHADSREQLDRIYQELSHCKDVLIAL